MPVRPKKRLGQHFLTDPNTIRRIADAVGAPPGAAVVEIGPGEGALTAELLRRYPDLVALEVDPEAVAHLRAAHPALDVRQQDVLDVDWPALAADLGGPLWVVGNLPYYITSPILFSLLEARQHVARAVVMVQKEVAERLAAPHGSKTYGTISVFFQLYAEVRLLFPVSRHVFRPKPEVESAVVGIDFAGRAGPGVDSAALRRTVRAAFGQRRKMLRNSLAGVASEGGLEVPEWAATLRPEALAPADFVRLARDLSAPA